MMGSREAHTARGSDEGGAELAASSAFTRSTAGVENAATSSLLIRRAAIPRHIMNRESESGLLDFVSAQHQRFHTDDWMAYSRLDRESLAAVVLFLAGVEWYGHRTELLRLAEVLCPGSHGHLSALAKKTGFDPSRFSNLLRHRLENAQTAP